jgi:hypothetical protein
MKKKQFFIPKGLKSFQDDVTGFSVLSHGFYNSAKGLLKIVEEEQLRYSNHVLSSVILFTTAIECYFNEVLTLSMYRINDEETLIYLEGLKLGYDSNTKLSFLQKIKEIFKLYDKDNKGIDPNGNIYQDLNALINLRNQIVHYNPNFEWIHKYPQELEILQNRIKIKLENAGWTTNYSNIEIGYWAKQTVKNTFIEFSKISGGDNPFTTNYLMRLWGE